jgi:hypothetical protein
MGWKCKSGCGRDIEPNTANTDKCAYDQQYTWEYHFINNNNVRVGFLFQCCNCAKKNRWSGFALHGCKHCKTRDQNVEEAHESRSEEDDTAFRDEFPRAEPVQFKMYVIQHEGQEGVSNGAWTTKRKSIVQVTCPNSKDSRPRRSIDPMTHLESMQAALRWHVMRCNQMALEIQDLNKKHKTSQRCDPSSTKRKEFLLLLKKKQSTYDEAHTNMLEARDLLQVAEKKWRRIDLSRRPTSAPARSICSTKDDCYSIRS